MLERPKMIVIIEHGCFAPLFKLLSNIGLYHAKEKLQQEHPDWNVKYDFD